MGGQPIDRAQLLRRAGVGAAVLLPLVTAAEAHAAEGNFAPHPRWRFIFVHHETTDPLYVATQFGAQDACALVGCDYRWLGSARGSVPEAVKALRAAIREKADGIAVSLPQPEAYTAAVREARRAGIPVIAFNVQGGAETLPYVGQNHYTAGLAAAKRLLAVTKSGEIVLLGPEHASVAVMRRQEGAQSAISAAASAHYSATVYYSRKERPSIVRTLENVHRDHPNLRGFIGLTQEATSALAEVGERRGAKRVRAAGFDLLPNEYWAVQKGHLDFVLDQQPYLQGFSVVLQLFLTRISQGLVRPSDVLVPPLILDKASLAVYLGTKSRYEGSSSRHDYPLARG